MNFSQFLLIILLSISSTHGLASQQCTSIFSTKIDTTSSLDADSEDLEYRLLHTLSSDVPIESSSLLKHYFLLLDIQQKLQKPINFSTTLREHLEDLFSSQYNIPQDSKDLHLFIQNRVHYLASRAAWDYKQLLINAISPHKLKGRQSLYAHALIDSYFTLSKMNDLDAHSEYIRRIIEQQPWNHFPWDTALELLDVWEKHILNNPDSTSFYKWYDTLNSPPQIVLKDLQRLLQSVANAEHKQNLVLCCKAAFACKQCPHNRFWLKKKEIK